MTLLVEMQLSYLRVEERSRLRCEVKTSLAGSRGGGRWARGSGHHMMDSVTCLLTQVPQAKEPNG